MADSPTYGWPLPEQETAPPDVVGWLGQLANAADGTVSTRILYGPVGSQPANLEPGQCYMGYD